MILKNSIYFISFAVLIIGTAGQTLLSDSSSNRSIVLSELAQSNPELNVEISGNFTSKDDSENMNRDKRTLGTMIQGVADLFGYDLLKRPSVIKEQRWFPPPLAPLSIEKPSVPARSAVLAIIHPQAISGTLVPQVPQSPTIHLQVHPPGPQVQVQTSPQAQRYQTHVQSHVQIQPQDQPLFQQIHIQPYAEPCVNSHTASQPCLQAAPVVQSEQPCFKEVPPNLQVVQPCLQTSAVQPCVNFSPQSTAVNQPCINVQNSPIQPCVNEAPQERQSIRPCPQAAPLPSCLNAIPQNLQAAKPRQPCLNTPVNPQQSQSSQQLVDSSQDIISSEFSNFNPTTQLNSGTGFSRPCSSGVTTLHQQGQQFQYLPGLQLQPGFNSASGLQFQQQQNQQQSTQDPVKLCPNTDSFQPCGNTNAVPNQLCANTVAVQPCANTAPVQPCLNAAAVQCANFQNLQQHEQPLGPSRSLSETVRRLFNLNFSFSRGSGSQTTLVRSPSVLPPTDPKASVVVSKPCVNAFPIACTSFSCTQNIRSNVAISPSKTNIPDNQTSPSSRQSESFNSFNTFENSRLLSPPLEYHEMQQKNYSYAPNYAQNFTPTNRRTTSYNLNNIPKVSKIHQKERHSNEAFSLEPTSEEFVRPSHTKEPDLKYYTHLKLNSNKFPKWHDNLQQNLPSGSNHVLDSLISTDSTEKNRRYGENRRKFTATKRSFSVTSETTDSPMKYHLQSNPEKMSFFQIPSMDDDDEFVTIPQHIQNEIKKNKQKSRTLNEPEFHKKYEQIEIKNPTSNGLTRIEEHTKKYVTVINNSTEIQNNTKSERKTKNKLKDNKITLRSDGLDLSRLRQKTTPIPLIIYTRDPNFDSLVQSIEGIYNKGKQYFNNNSTVKLKIRNKNNTRGNVKFQLPVEMVKNFQHNNLTKTSITEAKLIHDTVSTKDNSTGTTSFGDKSKDVKKNTRDKDISTSLPTHAIKAKLFISPKHPMMKENVNEHLRQLELQKSEIKRLQSLPANNFRGVEDNFTKIARLTHDAHIRQDYEKLQVTDPLTNYKEIKKIESQTKEYLQKVENPITRPYDERNKPSQRDTEKVFANVQQTPLPAIESYTQLPQQVELIKPTTYRNDHEVSITDVLPTKDFLVDYGKFDHLKSKTDSKFTKKPKQETERETRILKEKGHFKPENFVIQRVEKNLNFEKMPITHATPTKISLTTKALKRLENEHDQLLFASWENQIDPHSEERTNQRIKDDFFEVSNWSSTLTPVSLEHSEVSQETDNITWPITTFAQQQRNKLNKTYNTGLTPPQNSYNFKWNKTPNSREQVRNDESFSMKDAQQMSLEQPISVETEQSTEIETPSYEYTIKLEPHSSSTAIAASTANVHISRIPINLRVRNPARKGMFNNYADATATKFRNTHEIYPKSNNILNLKHKKVDPITLSDYSYNHKKGSKNPTSILYNLPYNYKKDQLTGKKQKRPQKQIDIDYYGKTSSYHPVDGDYFKEFDELSSAYPEPHSYYKYKTIPNDYNVYKPTKDELQLREKNDSRKRPIKEVTKYNEKVKNREISVQNGTNTKVNIINHRKKQPKSITEGQRSLRKRSLFFNKKNQMDSRNSFLGTLPSQLLESENNTKVKSKRRPAIAKHDYKHQKEKVKGAIKHNSLNHSRVKREFSEEDDEEKLTDEKSDEELTIGEEKEDVREKPPVNVPSLGYYEDKEFVELRNKNVRTLGDLSSRTRPRDRKKMRRGKAKSNHRREYYDEREFSDLEEMPLPNQYNEDILDKLSRIKLPKAKPIDYSIFEKFNVQDDEKGLSPRAYIKSKESKSAYVTTVRY